MRQILFELGCPLPDDAVFNQIDNAYIKVAFQRLCKEFGIINPDFRWKVGRNRGLGNIFSDYGAGYHGKGGGYQNVHIFRGYDKRADKYPNSLNKCLDEGGTRDNHISVIRNDDHGDFQYSWFAPIHGHGLKMVQKKHLPIQFLVHKLQQDVL